MNIWRHGRFSLQPIRYVKQKEHIFRFHSQSTETDFKIELSELFYIWKCWICLSWTFGAKTFKFPQNLTIRNEAKLLPCLFYAAHFTPITSVISHILSITNPLSHTCTTYRLVVLIKKQLTSAVEKWTNASCHTSDPSVEECKWTSDQLSIQSSLNCNFPCLCSPVSAANRSLFPILPILTITSGAMDHKWS